MLSTKRLTESKIFIATIYFCFLITACGDFSSTNTNLNATTNGDPARGLELFQRTVIGTQSSPGCITCHSLEEGVTIVGPSLDGIATRANNRLPNISAEEYLSQSITQPNDYIVDGFPSGVMYQNYKNSLTQQEINDLVAYLLTLK
jgi:nitric oxide reductase subunit C